jgi:predicted Zn-dependent protease with MMP-like domain
MTDEPNLDEFESLVADAIDALPAQVQGLLATVAVVVAEHGKERDAYGEYFGDGATLDYVEDRIVIYRDTLERDFGHDRAELARQVAQTLRHELAHHIGWDERGVDGLGL